MNFKKKKEIILAALGLFLSISFVYSNFSLYMLKTHNNPSTLQENEISGSNTIFHEDFNDTSNSWDLSDVPEKTIALSSIASEDSYVSSYDDMNNFGSDIKCKAGFEKGWFFDWGIFLGSSDLNPSDLFWDGSFWWILGATDQSVFRYEANWAISAAFYLGAEDGNPTDIFWDGTYWWMVGTTVGRAFRYSSDWIFTGVMTTLLGDGNPTGIYWDGTFWWVVGTQTDYVYQYTSGWGFTGISYNVGSQDGNPQDIFWDGTNWWMVGSNTNRVYKYNSSWAYTGVSYDLTLEDGTPTGIYWDGTNWWMVGTDNDTIHRYYNENYYHSYIKEEFPYLSSNYTGNSKLKVYVDSGEFPSNIDSYFTSNFDESTIVWNNKPSELDFLATTPVSGTGWVTINLSRPFYYYLLKSDSNYIEFNSSEASSNHPTINHYISKIFQGDGVLYCQTNETENLTLQSPNNYNFVLKEGDRVEVKFNTTSSNEIDFNLRNSGMLQKSYILSEMGNMNFSTKTVEFIIDEDITVDQLEFTGLFDDVENLIIDEIEINTPTFYIVSPENKTYTEPMIGYYPGVYGFEDEIAGTTGTNIDFVDSWNDAPSSVSIEPEIAGHKNVLREEYSGGSHGDLFHYFNTNHLYGRYEFWFRCGNPTTISQFLFMEGGLAGPHPQVKNGYFNFYNGTENYLIPCNPDQWYHLEFEWYLNNTFDWYVNGTRILKGGSNLNPMTLGPDRIRLTAYAVTTNYFDAFGNSWDMGYKMGDNLNQGLLLSFKNDIVSDKITYSLNAEPEKVILGNVSIPFPQDGYHSIKVFVNDSLGIVYQTDERYFAVDTTAPRSFIFYVPHSGTNNVNKSTQFTLSADDGLGSGVSVIKYKINDSTWFDYSVPFDLSNYDYGYYLITYYAVDLAGHVEAENTHLVKLIEISSEVVVLGYEIFLLIGYISIISIIIVKKRSKILK